MCNICNVNRCVKLTYIKHTKTCNQRVPNVWWIHQSFVQHLQCKHVGKACQQYKFQHNENNNSLYCKTCIHYMCYACCVFGIYVGLVAEVRPPCYILHINPVPCYGCRINSVPSCIVCNIIEPDYATLQIVSMALSSRFQPRCKHIRMQIW